MASPQPVLSDPKGDCLRRVAEAEARYTLACAAWREALEATESFATQPGRERPVPHYMEAIQG